MNASEFRRKIKPWMLPIAMFLGVLLHSYISLVAFLSPYLIFMMLLITYCKINPRRFVITRFIWSLLSVQVIGAIAAYLLMRGLGPEISQGVFICIFCPTATAAPVVTGMLGGSIELLATYSIVSNITVACLAPLLFSVIGDASGLSIFQSMLLIATKVFPLILAPLALALLMKVFSPRVHDMIACHQSLSFYMWAVALIIVVGNAVSFVMTEPVAKIPLMVAIAGAALLACCFQFVVGRMIGRRLGDKISGAQGLGQKNTVLAIWMALTYLNPLASVAPAAYVAWQNLINSTQLYLKARRDTISCENKLLTKKTVK